MERGVICIFDWFLKSVVHSIVRPKAKGIYGHVSQHQGNIKPFSTYPGWLTYFKRWYDMKNAKCIGEAGFADQEAMEEFRIY